MITVLGRPRRTCAGLTRRQLLQAGGAGLFGLTLPRVQAAAGAQPARARAAIFVLLYGGPSQLETFDLKPDAPSAIRGPFRPVASRTPGLRVCEHLPRLAACSDGFCVVRTVTHRQNDHNGTHYIQTGHPLPPAPRGADNVNATDRDWPAFGSVLQYLHGRAAGPPRALPGYVYLPRRLGHFAGYDINGQYAGWLGRAHDAVATDIRKRHALDNPYFRDCADDELDFCPPGLEPAAGLTLDRLSRREALLEQWEGARRRLDRAPAVRDYDARRARALALLTSPGVGAAFDVRREPARLRDRYGRNLFGQSLLLSRRLVEAGARFVTVAWDLAVRGDVMGSWDVHAGLGRVMRDLLLPGLDRGLSALLGDLRERGMLGETLVVAVGEIGRTPRFENRGRGDGRDHWSYCFPCVLAGGGIRGGVAYGRSDRDAAWPADGPVSPEDLACTLYHALGVAPHAPCLRDRQGRLVAPVEGGRVLSELFA